MPTLKTLIACSLLAAAAAASAQWQWTDATGRKVFSDQPPPADVPDKAILRRPPQPVAPRPGANGAAPVAAGGTAAAGTPAATANPAASASRAAPGKDSELEKRKAAADAAEAARKKEDEQKREAARADNCQRARNALTTLQSGVRITKLGASGERQFLEDDEKAAEVRRAQEVIKSDCAPPAR